MFRHFSRIGVKIFAVGAVLALAGMIAAPANATDPGKIKEVVLQTAGGVQAYGNYPVSAVGKAPISATFAGGTYACTAATASGTFHSTGYGYTNPYLTFTNLNITNCATPIPGVKVNVSLNCPVTVDATLPGNVHMALTDHAVAGLFNAGGCVRAVDTLGVCPMTVAGSASAAFDEDKGSGIQDLTLSGAGLTIATAGGVCSSLAGSGITLNVGFNISATDTLGNPGKINFRPDPNAAD